jgi:hypothetical protein
MRRLRFSHTADAPISPDDDRLDGGSTSNLKITTGPGSNVDPDSGMSTTGQRLVETYPPGVYFLVTLSGGRVQLWQTDVDAPTLDLGLTTAATRSASGELLKRGTGAAPTADEARARLRQVSRVQDARTTAILKRMNARAAEKWGRP